MCACTCWSNIHTEKPAQLAPNLTRCFHDAAGLLYKHVSCQARRENRPEKGVEVVDGIVQTAVQRCAHVQSMRQASTQMARPDLFLDTHGDRPLIAGASCLPLSLSRPCPGPPCDCTFMPRPCVWLYWCLRSLAWVRVQQPPCEDCMS